MSEHNVALVNEFIDQVMADHEIKNDARLCRLLGVFPPSISKLRKGTLNFSSSMILNFHETFCIPVAEIRARTGVKK